MDVNKAYKFFERFFLIFGGIATIVACAITFLALVAPQRTMQIIIQSVSPITLTPEIINVVITSTPMPPTSTNTPTVEPSATPDFVSTAIAIVSATELAQPTPTPYPTPEPLPTYTPYPRQVTNTPILRVVTATSTPEPALPETTLSLGEPYEQDGLSLTLSEVSLGEAWGQGAVSLDFIVRNQSNNEMNFSFDKRDLTIMDNLGNSFEIDSKNQICARRFNLEGGERLDTDFGCGSGFGPYYEGDYYDLSVDYLIITVSNFGRIKEAKWKFDVPH